MYKRQEWTYCPWFGIVESCSAIISAISLPFLSVLSSPSSCDLLLKWLVLRMSFVSILFLTLDNIYQNGTYSFSPRSSLLSTPGCVLRLLFTTGVRCSLSCSLSSSSLHLYIYLCCYLKQELVDPREIWGYVNKLLAIGSIFPVFMERSFSILIRAS